MALSRSLVGVLSVVFALGAPGAAAAQEPLRAGTWSVGVAGALSFSHDVPSHDAGTLRGYQLLPHVGYLATDEVGSGVVVGNLQLLAEPAIVHFDAEPSATAGGISAVGRWLFVGTGQVRPFLEVGLGALAGQFDLNETNCDVNFLLQVGAGAMLFLNKTTALHAGYRFQHLSNASTCSRNLGINSSAVVLGVDWFFP